MLIDTHVLLWAAATPERLSATQIKVLEDGETVRGSYAGLFEFVNRR